MIIKNKIENIIINEDIILTIGNFDGFHLGHQKLVNELKKSNFKKAIMTFEPHPRQIYKKDYLPLFSLDEKMNLLNQVDYLLIIEIDEFFLNLSHYEFIQILKRLHVKEIVIGKDFHFGKGNIGNVLDLKKEFMVYSENLILMNNEKVSTTKIKEFLDNGDITNTNLFLNRLYHLCGVVIEGNKLGRTLGFPTANLKLPSVYLPKNGVYFVEIVYNKNRYKGILNIGHNPTINYQLEKRVEVHILNFDKEIYGEYLDIYFISFLRDEKKFLNKDDLINGINKDKERILKYEINNGNCSK